MAQHDMVYRICGYGLAGHALPVDGGLTIQLQEDLAVGRGKFLQGRPDVLAKL